MSDIQRSDPRPGRSASLEARLASWFAAEVARAEADLGRQALDRTRRGTVAPGRTRSRLLSGGVIASALVALLAVALASGLLGSAGASPSPSPAPSLGDHQVATDQGIIGFGAIDGSYVVTLTVAGTTSELGRIAAPANGNQGLTMVCGPADGPDSRRYVFGHLESLGEFAYMGPPAIGRGAHDGTFLYALLPGTLGTSYEIRVTAGSTDPDRFVGFAGKAFSFAISTGQRQPSGCYVSD